jgi:hypothetical protein
MAQVASYSLLLRRTHVELLGEPNPESAKRIGSERDCFNDSRQSPENTGIARIHLRSAMLGHPIEALRYPRPLHTYFAPSRPHANQCRVHATVAA